MGVVVVVVERVSVPAKGEKGGVGGTWQHFKEIEVLPSGGRKGFRWW